MSNEEFKTVFYRYNRYTCNSLEKATEDNNMELWHRRMGHFNIDLLKDKISKK